MYAKTTIVAALLTVLPFLAQATPEAGLSIKHIDLSKRQDGGHHVFGLEQCTQVCNNYFGLGNGSPSNTKIAATSHAGRPSPTVQSAPTEPTSVIEVQATAEFSSQVVSIPIAVSTTAEESTTEATALPSAVTVESPSSTPSSATTSKPASNPVSSGSVTPIEGVTVAQQKALLDGHNAERAAYGAAPLTWNTEVEKYALSYASKCVWKHSNTDIYGENLSMSFGGDPVADAIRGWIDGERDAYDPSNPQYSHWTQVVWKATLEVGCAIVECPAGKLQSDGPAASITVCNYLEPGNYFGEFGAQVGSKV